MKKFLLLFLALALSLFLAACGGDKAEEGTKNEDTGSSQTAGEPAQDEEDELDVVNAAAVDDEFFKSIKSLLEENGYEVSAFEPSAHLLFPGATQAIQMVIDGEDGLPLMVYDLDPASEDLAKAKETGKPVMEYAGERVERDDVLLFNDHYYAFLAMGHPKHDDIYKLLEENFK